MGTARPSCAEPSPPPEVIRRETEETPHRLTVSVIIFVPHGWKLCVCCLRMCVYVCLKGQLVALHVWAVPWQSCHPLPPHTFSHLTFAGRVYVRPCPHTHTHIHSNTTVRPPRHEDNHEKATLCSQTAQSDHSGAPLTPMLPLLPTKLVKQACVCVCVCMCFEVFRPIRLP